MNRKKTNLGGFQSLISTSKDLFNNRISAIPNSTMLNTARFKGKLGAAIAVISSLIVGFLTIPNSILYFIDNKHSTRTRFNIEPIQPPSHESRPDYEYAYIHAGIALITLGCLAMVISIVLSYFALKSKRKVDNSEAGYMYPEVTKNTKTALVAIIVMNIELFMAVIKGCMEALYRPLVSDAQRLHNVECAIAVFNIIIYIMYVVTMVMTSTILKGKQDKISVDFQRDIPDVVPITPSAREYMGRSVNPYNSQSSYM